MNSRMYAFNKMFLWFILIVVFTFFCWIICDYKKIWEWINCNIEDIKTFEVVLSVLASLCTIIGVIIVTVVFFVVKWKKQRVNMFLNQCNVISEVISRIFKVYNDPKIPQEATFDKLRTEVTGIINDEKGVACLYRIFVDKKINKLIDIGQAVAELMQLNDRFKSDYNVKVKEITGHRSGRNNSTDDKQKKEYDDLLEKEYKDCNKLVNEKVTGIDCKIRNMYIKIAAMFRSPVS